ncbi:MAG: hypothetical protein ACRDNZ_07885 [Streptosporangiaceae bacterium]
MSINKVNVITRPGRHTDVAEDSRSPPAGPAAVAMDGKRGQGGALRMVT